MFFIFLAKNAAIVSQIRPEIYWYKVDYRYHLLLSLLLSFSLY